MIDNPPLLARLAGPLMIALAVLAPTQAPAAKLSALIKDPNGKPQEEAVLYAVPVSGAVPKPRGEYLIEQINRQYRPQVNVVQTGTSVNFPNRDPVRHHVYSFSPAKSFEIKLFSGTPSQSVVFDKPGEVVIGCNIHDQMIAHILVVDTPHFVKAGKDGKASLDNLPAGEYSVLAWHPNWQSPPKLARKLAASDNAELTIQLTAKSPQ